AGSKRRRSMSEHFLQPGLGLAGMIVYVEGHAVITLPGIPVQTYDGPDAEDTVANEKPLGAQDIIPSDLPDFHGDVMAVKEFDKQCSHDTSNPGTGQVRSHDS